MKKKFVVIVLFMFMIFTSYNLWFIPEHSIVSAQNNPELYDPWVSYYDENRVSFEVYYRDVDGDDGTVLLTIDDDAPVEMVTLDTDPAQGQYYEKLINIANIDDYTEFYFYAEDDTGDSTDLYDPYGDPFLVGDFLGWGEVPILSNPDVYFDGDDWVFNVTYQDPDDDEAEWIELFLDWNSYAMHTTDTDPYEGQNYVVKVLESSVNESTEFLFTAQDVNGSYTELYGPDYEPFVVGDFISGTEPVLSNPDVYLDESEKYVVFEVTYQDNDGDEGIVNLYLDDSEEPETMTTGDSNPALGQIYSVYIPIAQINEDTEFYFYANDQNSGDSYLNDEGGVPFTVGDFEVFRKGDDGTGVDLGPLGNPEVIVGIIALIAMGGGSAYGVWRRKKKRGRFSELLTKLDDVYSSYKLNPHKCETELEKIKGEINEDLKTNVIDENNYSILKDRIDEMLSEIRSETLHSEVKEIPKEIELRIKDMLIDGKITREEYDRLMPVIKGSEMTSADKEKMEKLVESWVKEDKEKTAK